MNRSAFFKTHVCKRTYGYLAQHTAQLSRHAIACGSREAVLSKIREPQAQNS